MINLTQQTAVVIFPYIQQIVGAVSRVGNADSKKINILKSIYMPSWELTYPLPADTFEKLFSSSQGGNCDRSLEGICWESLRGSVAPSNSEAKNGDFAKL